MMQRIRKDNMSVTHVVWGGYDSSPRRIERNPETDSDLFVANNMEEAESLDCVGQIDQYLERYMTRKKAFKSERIYYFTTMAELTDLASRWKESVEMPNKYLTAIYCDLLANMFPKTDMERRLCHEVFHSVFAGYDPSANGGMSAGPKHFLAQDPFFEHLKHERQLVRDLRRDRIIYLRHLNGAKEQIARTEKVIEYAIDVWQIALKRALFGHWKALTGLVKSKRKSEQQWVARLGEFFKSRIPTPEQRRFNDWRRNMRFAKYAKKLEALEEENENLKIQNEKYEHEILPLRMRLAEAESQARLAAIKVKNLETAAEQARDAEQAVSRERLELRDQKSLLQTEAMAYRHEQEKARELYDTLQSEFDKLMDKHVHLETDHQVLKNDMDTLQEEKGILMDQVVLLERQMRQVREQHEKDLKQMRERLQRLMQSQSEEHKRALNAVVAEMEVLRADSQLREEHEKHLAELENNRKQLLAQANARKVGVVSLIRKQMTKLKNKIAGRIPKPKVVESDIKLSSPLGKVLEQVVIAQRDLIRHMNEKGVKQTMDEVRQDAGLAKVMHGSVISARQTQEKLNAALGIKPRPSDMRLSLVQLDERELRCFNSLHTSDADYHSMFPVTTQKVDRMNILQQIEDYLVTCGDQIAKIYRYYSASAGGGNLSTMSLREWVTLLSDCRLFGSRRFTQRRASVIFSQSAAMSKNGEQEITPWTFAGALLRVASELRPSKKQRKKPKPELADEDAELGKVEEEPELVRRFKHLCERDVFPLAQQADLLLFRRAVMQDERILKIMKKWKYPLKRVYIWYASADKRSQHTETMNVVEFMRILKDCQVFGASFPVQFAQLIFANINHLHSDGGHSHEDFSNMEISFPEFVEGMLAACCFINPNPYTPLYLKFRYFLSKVLLPNAKKVSARAAQRQEVSEYGWLFDFGHLDDSDNHHDPHEEDAAFMDSHNDSELPADTLVPESEGNEEATSANHVWDNGGGDADASDVLMDTLTFNNLQEDTKPSDESTSGADQHMLLSSEGDVQVQDGALLTTSQFEHALAQM